MIEAPLIETLRPVGGPHSIGQGSRRALCFTRPSKCGPVSFRKSSAAYLHDGVECARDIVAVFSRSRSPNPCLGFLQSREAQGEGSCRVNNKGNFRLSRFQRLFFYDSVAGFSGHSGRWYVVPETSGGETKCDEQACSRFE